MGEKPPELSAVLIAAWLTSGLDLPEPEALTALALYAAAVYEAVLLAMPAGPDDSGPADAGLCVLVACSSAAAMSGLLLLLPGVMATLWYGLRCGLLASSTLVGAANAP